MCCRYLALPIETPEDREDFDDIRWYLLHEGVSVFVEDGEWYLYVAADCRHLQPDYRCGIYATRPRICRKYTTENCDYHSGDYGWDLHFTCPEHLDEYARAFLAEQRRGRSKSRQGPRPPRVKVRLAARRPAQTQPGYADRAVDIAGRPLPTLGAQR
jgi:Fe-S-cluster containining protein